MKRKIYTPSYYKDFKCIGGKCKHNCCIGWEIDIDADTMQKYENVKGVFKNRFDSCIDRSGDAPHFILDKNERCPFLNSDNLCDIITEYGEGYLCEICNAHPRFRNFFSDREEIGLGLCCEEAARIILTQGGEFSLVCTKNNDKSQRPSREEKRVLKLKKNLLKTVNSNKTPEELLSFLSKYTDADIEGMLNASCIDFLLSLEIMDEGWRNILTSVSKDKFKPTVDRYERELKSLLSYFMYRHITYEEYDYDTLAIVLFCIFSAIFIVSLCSCLDNADIQSICRLYSAEIEYSRENTEAIISHLWRNTR